MIYDKVKMILDLPKCPKYFFWLPTTFRIDKRLLESLEVLDNVYEAKEVLEAP